MDLKREHRREGIGVVIRASRRMFKGLIRMYYNDVHSLHLIHPPTGGIMVKQWIWTYGTRMFEIKGTICSIPKAGLIGVNRKLSTTVVLISSTVEGMTSTQLSAIAQQVIDMQEEEEDLPRPSAAVEEDPITPTRERPTRQSASTRKHSSLVPDTEEPNKKPKHEGRKKAKASSSTTAMKGGPAPGGRERTTPKPEPKKMVPKAKKQRTFNGRVSMTARPLGRSDGQKRGEGVWPEKGQNTVKGNMVRSPFSMRRRLM